MVVLPNLIPSRINFEMSRIPNSYDAWNFGAYSSHNSGSTKLEKAIVETGPWIYYGVAFLS